MRQPTVSWLSGVRRRLRLIEQPESEPQPIAETRELGFMLHDLDFSNASDPQPRFFRAQLSQGAVAVPRWDSQEVRG
ncbi:hypothetical protein RLIN73S_03163 [Rhodanobacter lindaniclasticus]